MAQKHVERGFSEMSMLYEQTPQHNFWIASIQRLSIESAFLGTNPEDIVRISVIDLTQRGT
jgi:hypothetical protein